jgi:hypothetical protein
MTVTGHRTRAVFDRYHIVSPGDLQDVARRLASTITGTVGGSAVPGVGGRIVRSAGRPPASYTGAAPLTGPSHRPPY